MLLAYLFKYKDPIPQSPDIGFESDVSELEERLGESAIISPVRILLSGEEAAEHAPNHNDEGAEEGAEKGGEEGAEERGGLAEGVEEGAEEGGGLVEKAPELLIDVAQSFHMSAVEEAILPQAVEFEPNPAICSKRDFELCKDDMLGYVRKVHKAFRERQQSKSPSIKVQTLTTVFSLYLSHPNTPENKKE